MLSMTKVVAVAVAALLIGCPAVAQDKKTLKYASVFPAAHWHFTESVKLFQEEVTKATGGKAQFENYHGGVLGKEGVGILSSGLADIAILVPGYETAKLPLSGVVELPGMYSTSCEGTTKFWNIAKDGGALNNAEYKPQGMKVLYGIALPPFEIMTTSKKVASMSDVSGLKLRANGSSMDKTVRALGGVPVSVTSPEFYDALTRGTVDGGLWPIGVTRFSGLEKVFHFAIQGPMLPGSIAIVAMRQKSWDALTPDVKEAIASAAANTQKHLCEWADRQNVEEALWLQKQQGLVLTKVADKELARWNERVAPVADGWAKEMDSTNRPGTAVLKAFRDAPSK